MCCAPDEDTLLQWLDALHVEVSRVALEAKQEEMADHKAFQLHRYHSVGSEMNHHHQHQQQDGHEGDGEDNTGPVRVRSKLLGRTARLKINLHNSLPRSRAKSGDASAPSTGLFGSSNSSSNPSPGGMQIRKVLSLDSAASSPPATPSTPTKPTATGNNVTFHIPAVPNVQPTLPSPSATATFSA